LKRIAQIFILFTLPVSLLATEKKMVISYCTPAWNNVTNKDGTGLYHDVVNEAFAGHEISVTYAKLKRCIALLNQGKIHLTGGLSKDKEYGQAIFAKYPILSSSFSAILHKDLESSWKGLSTLIKSPNSVVGPAHVNDFFKNVKFQEKNTREQSLRMLIKRRAKYYIDITMLVDSLFSDAVNPIGVEGKDINLVNRQKLKKDFTSKFIQGQDFFMIFPNTKKGKRIKNIFDNGVLKGFKSGKLKKTYEKWGAAPIAI